MTQFEEHLTCTQIPLNAVILPGSQLDWAGSDSSTLLTSIGQRRRLGTSDEQMIMTTV